MTVKRRPAKKSRAQAGRKRPAVVRYKFGDGKEAVVPLAEVQRQLQRQYHRMAESDSPELRAAGERKLRESSEREAASIVANLQRVNASRNKRPKALSPLRQKIVAVMRSYKRGGASFKTFFAAWERNALKGLRLSREGEASALADQIYKIDDENGSALQASKYKYSSLGNLWSKA